jgi:hypothetical protein
MRRQGRRPRRDSPVSNAAGEESSVTEQITIAVPAPVSASIVHTPKRQDPHPPRRGKKPTQYRRWIVHTLGRREDEADEPVTNVASTGLNAPGTCLATGAYCVMKPVR